jgi:hypothetical protein
MYFYLAILIVSTSMQQRLFILFKMLMKKKILFLGVGMFSLLGTCRADQSFTLTMQSDRSEYIG